MARKDVLLIAEKLERRYPLARPGLFSARPWLTAVKDVSLRVAAGETLGILGESGSGKSTLARLLMALERPDGGRVLFEGEDLALLAPSALRARRRHFQMVFQDPYGSLDPRLSVFESVAEPLRIAEPGWNRARHEATVAAMLTAVGLSPDAMERYPHQFSGGQRQRIAIARAFVTNPKLVIADEPVSALDVSIQAQILNLFADLQEQHGTAMVFISHNLAVLRHVADQVVVMYRGEIVEAGDAEAVFSNPRHPYTIRLLSAVLPV